MIVRKDLKFGSSGVSVVIFWHRRVATSLRIKAECISSLKPHPFLGLFGLAVDYGVLGSTFYFRKVFA